LISLNYVLKSAVIFISIVNDVIGYAYFPPKQFNLAVIFTSFLIPVPFIDMVLRMSCLTNATSPMLLPRHFMAPS